MRDGAESDEGVPFTCRVGLSGEESIKQLRSVGDEVFMVLIDGIGCKDGVLADEGMAVLLSRELGRVITGYVRDRIERWGLGVRVVPLPGSSAESEG